MNDFKDGNIQEFIDVIEEGEVEKAKSIAESLLQNNYSIREIINGLVKALDTVGEKLDSGEYFLPDLFVSAEAAKSVLSMLEPHFSKSDEYFGTVVIGTVQGDVHDIGLNLVALTLEGSGFRVINLGVNVSAETFLSKVQEENADILAMSALLTTTMVYMQRVIKLMEEKTLRNKVKVLIGGAPTSEDFAQKIGADAYGETAREAVSKTRELLGIK